MDNRESDPEGAQSEAGEVVDAAAEVDAGWVASMEQKLDNLSRRGRCPKPTIFRVPENMRKVRSSAYEPRIISFGPYHNGRKHLQAMEEHKWRYLRCFLSHQIGSRSVEDYMRKMKALEDRTRSRYAEATCLMDSSEFVEMMTLDGCFIVELIIRRSLSAEDYVSRVQDDDHVHGPHWVLPLILNDMLLLENQLPFFVLQEVWDLYNGNHERGSDLVGGFLKLFQHLSPTNPRELQSPLPSHLTAPHHLLDLFHSYLLPISQPGGSEDLESLSRATQLNEAGPMSRKLIPSATQLNEAGVKFREKKGANALEATFARGEMHMCLLRIYDNTDACFGNLIAFEQCFPDAGNRVSTHAVLMDCLIDTPADVALLKRCGLLINGMSSDEEAASFFNNLCKEATYSYDKGMLYEDVNSYYKKKWPKWRAELVHKYFGNPWTVISVVAAFILLLLTLVQALFSVLSYAK